MTKEKQEIEALARAKFDALPDAVKQQFGAMLENSEHGEAF
jgi:hypothetical protein